MRASDPFVTYMRGVTYLATISAMCICLYIISMLASDNCKIIGGGELEATCVEWWINRYQQLLAALIALAAAIAFGTPVWRQLRVMHSQLAEARKQSKMQMRQLSEMQKQSALQILPFYSQEHDLLNQERDALWHLKAAAGSIKLAVDSFDKEWAPALYDTFVEAIKTRNERFVTAYQDYRRYQSPRSLNHRRAKRELLSAAIEFSMKIREFTAHHDQQRIYAGEELTFLAIPHPAVAALITLVHEFQTDMDKYLDLLDGFVSEQIWAIEHLITSSKAIAEGN